MTICHGCQHLEDYHRPTSTTYRADPNCKWSGCGCPWFVLQDAAAAADADAEPPLDKTLPSIIIESSPASSVHSVTCFECGFLGDSVSLQVSLNVRSAHLREHAREQTQKGNHVSDGK